MKPEVGGATKADDNEKSPLLHQPPRLSQATYGSESTRQQSNGAVGGVPLDVIRHRGNWLQRCLIPVVFILKKSSWSIPYLIGMFWFSALFSVPITFFPAVASKKGLESWEFGLTFSVRKVAGLLAPATSMATMSYLSPKWGVVISQTMFGIQGILFGLSFMLTDKNVFLGVSFIGFVILEYSLVAINICVETILASTLQEDGNLFLGAARSLSEAGMVLAPIAAGVLVDITDDAVPYYVFGSLLLVFTPLVARSRHETRDFVPQPPGGDVNSGVESNEPTRTQKSLWRLFLNPFFIADVFSRILSWVTASFNAATLEPYIAQLHESNACIGATFTVNAFASTVAYAATCHSYSRKYENFWIFVGITLIGISFLIIGPAPFIHVEPNFVLICISQALRGVGAGFILVCGYSHAMRIAVEEEEYPDDVKTRGFVSGTSAFFSSLLTVPLAPLAGLLVSKYGYRATSMWMFGIHAIWAVITGLIWIGRGPFRMKKRDSFSSQDDSTESGPNIHCTYPIIDSSQPLT
ncbi:MFS-type transporter SLC18B1-like isoform X1 [Amblyomma americanum]